MLGAVRRFFGRLGEDIARESREWMIRCDACGRERSLWSAGGVRYKAFGKKRTLGHCSGCGGLRVMTIYHPEKSPLRAASR